MPSRILARLSAALVTCACLAAALVPAGCSKAAPASIYERLLDFIRTVKVINTHEHQRWFPQYDGRDLNFYTLLAHSYLQSDLVSAGAPPLKTDAVEEDLDALWATYGPYLDACRATSYYGQFAAGFRLLYGFSDPAFTAAGAREISVRIAANYRTPEARKAWYAQACEKAGSELMFVDTYWNAYDTEPDSPFFARVERGLLTEEAARDIGRMIFRDNAIGFFKLREKRPGLTVHGSTARSGQDKGRGRQAGS